MALRAGIFADQLFYDQPGGIGTYLRHIIPGMAARLGEGSLVLGHHGPKDARLFPDLERVEEIRIPMRRDVLGTSWQALGIPSIERYLGPLDLVHTPSLVFTPSRAPLVATIHDLCVVKYPWAFPFRWRVFHRRALGLVLKHARVILSDSTSTRDDLYTLIGEKDPRIRVAPLGVDAVGGPTEVKIADVLSKYGLTPGYVLFVGTIEPRKNLSRLVKAYASFDVEEKAKSGELILVGAAGWMGRRELSRLLSQQGVRWLGFLPQEDLEAVYAAASIFVYPSLYEGFGLPVLEAMARGIPVVTSDTSSLREVGEGVALLVDPEDTMELGKAMRRLIYDKSMRKELSELGREKAVGYSWERTAALTLEAYNGML